MYNISKLCIYWLCRPIYSNLTCSGYGDVVCITALGRGFQVLFLLVGLVSRQLVYVYSLQIRKRMFISVAIEKEWKIALYTILFSLKMTQTEKVLLRFGEGGK